MTASEISQRFEIVAIIMWIFTTEDIKLYFINEIQKNEFPLKGETVQHLIKLLLQRRKLLIC